MTSTLGPAAENGAGPRVRLGEHEYHVYPQRHAYLTNRLGRAFGELQDFSGIDASSGLDGFLGSIGDRAYGLLSVFIPQLMPEYEFRGFATVEAMEKGEYDEEYDRSPSLPEVITAFETALKVNRLDLLKHLGKVIRLDLLQAYMNKAMAEFLESQMQPNSSLEAATSGSTSSGTTPPT